MIRRMLLLSCALGSLILPIAAGATELQFSYYQPEYTGPDPTPAYNFSFDLSSNPVPSAFSLPIISTDNPGSDYAGTFTLSTANWQGSFPDPTYVRFYSTTASNLALTYDGGFVAGTLSPAFTQLYSGPENAPHFSTGTYSLNFPVGSLPNYNCCSTVTITALAVPEANTWAMMLVGMGAIGFTIRRRQAVSVAYA